MVAMFSSAIVTMLIVAVELHSATASSCRGSMQYSVMFEGMWSGMRHPVLYPSNAVFAPIVVASHSGDVKVWSEGELASPSVQIVAETGNPTPLRMDLQGLQVPDLVTDFTHSPRPISSTDFTTLDITVTSNHEYISLITMLAPSPDWFTGLDSYSLCKNGKWVTEETVYLMAYDAGTDSGASFTATDVATNPFEPISKIPCGQGVFCEDGEEFLPVASVKFMAAGNECQGSQAYKVDFTGSWSAVNHPVAYPSNGHFSPPVYATHARAFSFVNSGNMVTPGVQAVAESGATDMVLGELNSERKLGIVADYITGPYGYVVADSGHELFSVVSMLAPSPDWVVSNRTSLCNAANRRWKKEVTMYFTAAYDVGTDSGVTFLSENLETVPQAPISTFRCGTGVFCNAGETIYPLAKVVLKAVGVDDVQPCRGERTFNIRLAGRWSGSRHPLEYPGNAHFSPFVLASHSAEYSLFKIGEPATDGLKSIAETGMTMMLRNELFMARMSGAVADVGVSGGPIDGSGTSEVVQVSVDPSHPYITLVAMVAPSPDWFISTTIDMCNRGKWLKDVDLRLDSVYDAGTDSGSTFTSTDAPETEAQGVSYFTCGTGVFCEDGEVFNAIARVEIEN